MSKLARFLGKSEIVKIAGEDIEIFPLTFDESDDILNLTSLSEAIKKAALKNIITKSLKKSFPDATEEEIKNFDIRYLNDFLNAVLKISGLEIDEKKFMEMKADSTQKI